MRSQQSGFTLVEIAIVLVIIGLLLGGILKGQELINSAKVKNLANDFRVIPTYIYAYQDKFKALPGDDIQADTHLPTGVAADKGNGNSIIDGTWDSTAAADESFRFWRAVRLANLAAGSTDLANIPEYQPRNAVSGIIGVSSMAGAPQIAITGMSGSFQICSRGILGKFAKQLDIQMDDGNTATGAMRTMIDTGTVAGVALATTAVDDSIVYTVCMAF
jgi:prepilin-type N-terminal cleavage/methylation domain-containing protein